MKLASHGGVFRGARFSLGRDERRAPLKFKNAWVGGYNETGS